MTQPSWSRLPPLAPPHPRKPWGLTPISTKKNRVKSSTNQSLTNSRKRNLPFALLHPRNALLQPKSLSSTRTPPLAPLHPRNRRQALKNRRRKAAHRFRRNQRRPFGRARITNPIQALRTSRNWLSSASTPSPDSLSGAGANLRFRD